MASFDIPLSFNTLNISSISLAFPRANTLKHPSIVSFDILLSFNTLNIFSISLAFP